MNRKPYGPVPVSRIKPEAKTIFEALAAGRPVHISRYGQVVAVIDPPATIPRELLAEYALGDHVGFPELTATEINQGAPASAILAVAARGPRYVTRKHRVRGFLRQVTDSDLATSEPSDEQLAERERRLAEYLKTHPDTDIAALANYGDQVDQELGISQIETDVRPQDLLGVERSQRLLETIKEVSRRFAANAGDLVGTSPRVLSGRDEIVSEFESLTTEAIAGVASTVLHGVAQRTKVHEVEAIRLQGIEHRAELALSRLESGTLAEGEGEVVQTVAVTLAADLALPIEELNLTLRSYNCLKRAGIHNVGELVARSEQDLLDIRDFGAASMEEVKGKLTDMGLALRDSAAGFDAGTAADSYGADDDSYVETEQY